MKIHKMPVEFFCFQEFFLFFDIVKIKGVLKQEDVKKRGVTEQIRSVFGSNLQFLCKKTA